ncbi:MAG: glycoside hydrolase family 5 protein [Rhodoglobus sp.]
MPTHRMLKGKRLAASVLTAGVLLASFVTFTPATSADAVEEPSVDVVLPETVRGVNTYGAAVTQQGAQELRDEYGANVVRLQIHPQNYAQQKGVSLEQAWDDVLDLTEQGLIEAARKGMVTVLDLHSVPIPGSKNASAFWADDATLDVLIECWEEIVQRFAPYRDYIWGYDLLNEAHNTAELPLGAAKWPGWAQQITDAIRELDSTTSIIFEPSPGALPRGFIEDEWIDAGPGYPVQYQGEFPLIDDDNVIYSVHWYELHAYTHQGISSNNSAPVSTDWPDKMVYPGWNGDQYWDKQTLRELMQPIVDIQQKYGVRIYVGEFSTVRWAPGASQYIRDSVELFEEFGWSWTYHSYRDWHGWQLDYTDTMTSDANSASALAVDPTDRELTLKSYFDRNEYVEPLDIPREPTDLIRNGSFLNDSNQDGLADNWLKGANAQVSMVSTGGVNAQQAQVTASGQRGVDQEWIAITPGNRYLLKASIRVDQGQARFWHYDVSNTYAFVGSGIVSTLGPTHGEFVDRELEFVPATGTGRVSVRLWSNTPATFAVRSVQLIDLGPSEVIVPPATTAMVSDAAEGSPVRVEFEAEAGEGKTIERTEYRIVGSSETWTTLDVDGLLLPDPGTFIIGYRSVDSAGLVEPGRAIVVTVAADTTAPTVTVKEGDSFTVGSAGAYSLVSFKLYDAVGIDKLSVNGVVKDLTNNVWSDLNFVEPGVFGGVAGANTLVVYDLAGNSSTYEFTLA